MIKNFIQNLGQIFRYFSRLWLYFVVLVLSSFLTFLILKTVIHWFVWVQNNWPPVWKCF